MFRLYLNPLYNENIIQKQFAVCYSKQRHSPFLYPMTHCCCIQKMYQSHLLGAKDYSYRKTFITKYTKTKYFLSVYMPMCRIKMIFDSSLWCVRHCVTEVYTSHQCFTQEGYTYFLIHRTGFEFGVS